MEETQTGKMASAEISERNVIRLVRKSNELVEARYRFDIWETRIFTKMLTMVRPEDKDFKTYRIYLRDIVQEFCIENNKDAYARLRAGAFKLMSKIVRVVRQTDEGLMEFNAPIVVGVRNLVKQKDEDSKFLEVSFHPEMKPFLLSLRSHFTTYDVRNILKLPSSYSIRIYELLKQYQKIGHRRVSLQELKEIIGVVEEVDINGKKKFKDKYPLYGNFKQRVLLKAQRDLEKYTDIVFRFEQIKRGRAVHELIFEIHTNPKSEITVDFGFKAIKKENIHNHKLQELYVLISPYIAFKTLLEWSDKYPIEQIQRGIVYTLAQMKQGKTIQNVAGYLQKMIQQETILDAQEVQRTVAAQDKKTTQDLKQQKTELEEKLKALHNRRIAEESQLINQIFHTTPNIRSSVIKGLQHAKMCPYDSSKSLEDNLESPMIRAAFRNYMEKQYPHDFARISQKYNPEIQRVKQNIYQL
ncbi:MAG: replication initiation protein [Bacteroidota bacterium]